MSQNHPTSAVQGENNSDDSFQACDQAETKELTVLKTNRTKAVIFINIFAVASFAFTATLKIALTEKGIHPLDMCLFRTLMMFFGSFSMVYFMKIPLYVEKKDRLWLLVRCILGLIAYTVLIFGIPMVPLVVQQTIFNTAPFWASILGWFLNNEKISTFEIIALILSFLGVLCVSFSG